MDKKIKLTNLKSRRIRITGIHREDATYGRQEDYIGKTGLFAPEDHQNEPGYFAGNIVYDDDFNGCTFLYAVRYKRI